MFWTMILCGTPVVRSHTRHFCAIGGVKGRSLMIGETRYGDYEVGTKFKASAPA